MYRVPIPPWVEARVEVYIASRDTTDDTYEEMKGLISTDESVLISHHSGELTNRADIDKPLRKQPEITAYPCLSQLFCSIPPKSIGGREQALLLVRSVYQWVFAGFQRARSAVW